MKVLVIASDSLIAYSYEKSQPTSTSYPGSFLLPKAACEVEPASAESRGFSSGSPVSSPREC